MSLVLLVFFFQLTFFFSWFYIRFYQDHSQSEVSSTLTAIFALFIALLTSALVPVDVFLVSYMKNPDGSWKVLYVAGGGGGGGVRGGGGGGEEGRRGWWGLRGCTHSLGYGHTFWLVAESQ